ncbi:MAG: hypothetical protein AAF542_20265 [Pseudomonadota bacterium]
MGNKAASQFLKAVWFTTTLFAIAVFLFLALPGGNGANQDRFHSENGPPNVEKLDLGPSLVLNTSDIANTLPGYNPPEIPQSFHAKKPRVKFFVEEITSLPFCLSLEKDQYSLAAPKTPWFHKLKRTSLHRTSSWSDSNLQYKGCVTYHAPPSRLT